MTETPSAWERVKNIVADVLDVPPAQRRETLERACGGDQQLIDEVSSLINASENSTGVIDRRTDSFLGIDGTDAISLAGQRIGRYRLESLIAEGAMAAVYVAQQTSPERKVALKILRTSLPMLDAVQRFKREAAALGRLKHPNIAQIYESGVHRIDNSAATPFLAMELVDGKPLNKYARENTLSREAKIILIIKVARAVHAAHQQAVIHRDLKPANVLVEQSGEPKVLDFGIARIVGVDEEYSTWQTTAGVLLGTPGYMSPEQAGGNQQLVDVRSDVWSLGVLLFEILTNRLPVEVKNTSIVEALKRIENTEPPPLSEVDASLRGDLETIVSTALSREKEQRYSSAEAFADDLQRVLDYEPISARAPSRWYRLKKFARRNRVGISVATVLLLSLISGAVIASIGFVRASVERDRAKAVNTFLLELMSTTDPQIGKRDITVAEALEGSGKLIDKNFANDAIAQADVRSTIGWTLYQLGKYDSAVDQLKRAVELRKSSFGEFHERTFDDLTRLATAVRWQYKPAEALAIAEPAYKAAVRHIGSENPSTLALLDNYAGALDDLGRYDEAEPLYNTAIELNTKVSGPNDVQTLSAMNNLAVVYINQGRWADAERELRRVIEGRAKSQKRRVALLTNRHNLATVLANQGKYDEALAEFKATIDDSLAEMGPEHSKTLSVQVSYGDALMRVGRADEALEIQRAVYKQRLASLGVGHEQTLVSEHNVVNALLASERFSEAEPAARQLVANFDQYSAPDYLGRILSRQNLAAALSGLKRYDEAEKLQREVVGKLIQKFGADHTRTINAQIGLAVMLIETDRAADALAIVLPIGDAMKRKPSPALQPAYLRTLGRAQLALKQFDAAEKSLLGAYELETAEHDLKNAAKVSADLVKLYEATGQQEKAAQWAAPEG